MSFSRILIASLLGCSLAPSQSAVAANLANGKALYVNTPNIYNISALDDCATSTCHGTNPALNLNKILNGTNWANTKAAINGGVGTMAHFGPVNSGVNPTFGGTALTDAELSDMAAYIANPTAGAILSASATTLAFATTAFGASPAPTKTITISNTGLTDLSVTSATGLAAADFGVANNCTAAVASNANCTIAVSLLTGVAGAKTGTLAIAYNGGSQNVAVSGTISGSASVSLNAPSGGLTFPNTTVSASSAATSGNVTLTNSGVAALTFSAFTLPADFTLDQTSPTACKAGTSVAAGQTCTLSVMFTPGSAGAKAGALSIAYNGTASPATINLSGLGLAASTPTPAATFSPSTLPSFGDQTIGTASTTKTVTLSNGGTKPLTISNIQDSNGTEFLRTGTCASGAIAIGASCTVIVAFNPASVGAKSATITITDDAGNVVNATQRIDLSGTGVAVALPTPTLSVPSIDFGNQDLNTTSAAKILTITNSSATEVLTIASIGIAGANADEYSVDNSAANACAASCQRRLRAMCQSNFCRPLPGHETANLIVTTNATGTTLTVPLSGSGSAVAGPPTTSTPATNVGAGGCSIQSSQSFDPILAALFLFSLTTILARRRMNLRYRRMPNADKNGIHFNNQNLIYARRYR